MDRGFDVPDLAGYSTNGRTVFIDRSFKPKEGLEGIEIDALTQHEHVEKTLIDVLGYSYSAAHEMATTAEHRILLRSGVHPDVYEKALKPFIKRAEHEKITKPPLDLDCHPYYDDPDSQDLKILAHLAKLGVADAQHPQHKLEQGTVAYGPGHRDERCKFCVHYTSPGCALVQSPISPEGWCKLWTKKSKP